MNKRVIMVSVLSLLVVMSWYLGNMKLRQLHPEWYVEPKPEQAAGQTDNPAPPGTQPATQAATQVTTQAVVPVPATQSAAIRAVGGNGKPAEIGWSKFDPSGTDSVFPMGVAIDPQGAAISSVTLNRLRAKQGKNDPYVFQKPYKDLDPQYNRSLLTQAIFVDGKNVELHDQNWSLEASSTNSATYSIDVLLADGKKLKGSKIF